MIYDGLYEKIVAAIKTAAAEVYPIYLITKNGIYKYVSQISINHWFEFKIKNYADVTELRYSVRFYDAEEGMVPDTLTGGIQHISLPICNKM